MPARRRDPQSPMPYPRTARINRLLREVIAEEVERLADGDDRLRLMTVTGVSTTADLRHATVFLASLPLDAAEALGAQRVHLQHVVGRQVRMKRTPHLEFVADPAVNSADRIEDILRRLQREEREQRESGQAGDEPSDGGQAGVEPGEGGP